MHIFDIESQKKVLETYITSIESAIEKKESFINAIDLEIMRIAKNILSEELDEKLVNRAFTILDEKTEQDTLYTVRHIDVCKAVRYVYFSVISESESAIPVSRVTEFEQEQVEDRTMLARVNELLKQTEEQDMLARVNEMLKPFAKYE